MTGEQLALDLEALPAPARTPEQAARHLWLVPPLGDRRAASRLDPHGRRGLEDGDAEVIVRGWGRPVSDVHVALGRL